MPDLHRSRRHSNHWQTQMTPSHQQRQIGLWPDVAAAVEVGVEVGVEAEVGVEVEDEVEVAVACLATTTINLKMMSTPST